MSTLGEQALAYVALLGSDKIPYDSDGTQKRVEIVRLLERMTGKEFKNTADMKAKVNHFTAFGGHRGEDIKTARKMRGWSQADLGICLGISAQFVKEMEKGRKPLTDKAISFIEGR